MPAVRLRSRNRQVLFAHGSHEVKQTIEREFERVTTLVQRDLEGYPVLQRKLIDEITRIEEDYKKTGEVPLPPPDWVKAIEAIAKIKTSAATGWSSTFFLKSVMRSTRSTRKSCPSTAAPTRSGIIF